MAERRIEDYLYGGESVRRAFDVGDSRVVVTSHRVAVVTPESDAVQQTERLNVTGVDLATRGSGRWLWTSMLLGFVAVPLVALGLVVDVGDLGNVNEVDQGGADAIGAGGVTDLLEWVLALAANLDVIMLYTGLGLLGLAGLLAAVYWLVIRTATVAIRLAGDQADIHVPRGTAGAATAAALERVILGDEDRTADAADAGPADASESDGDPGLPADEMSGALPADALLALPATAVEGGAGESEAVETDGPDTTGGNH